MKRSAAYGLGGGLLVFAIVMVTLTLFLPILFVLVIVTDIIGLAPVVVAIIMLGVFLWRNW